MMHAKRSTAAKRIFRLTVILMPCLAALGILFAFWQMSRLETGVLDICATEQDAYVELVLDQINLKSDRADEEIITEILGTLDASTNQYWIFSSEEAMLFVKDVTETNKYKGFTSSAYEISDSAEDFLSQLMLNRVTHAMVTIDGRQYVASGVAFAYQGQTYRLCLLTNRATVLDNNQFLGAKTELWILLFTLAGLLIVIPILLARSLWSLGGAYAQSEQTIQALNESIVKLNDRLSGSDLHDTRSNLWQSAALPKFAQRLTEKAVAPVALLRIHCENAEDRQQFLSLSHYVLDRSVLRFACGESDLILLFVETDLEAASLSVMPLLSRQTVIARSVEAGKPEQPSVAEAAQSLAQ